MPVNAETTGPLREKSNIASTNEKQSSLFGPLDDDPPSEMDRAVDSIWKPCWIDYPAATAGLEKLRSIYRHPRTSRPPCLLIVGLPNSGKTSLVKEFEREVTPARSDDDELDWAPVMYVQAPPTADASALYLSILRRIEAPEECTGRITKLQDQTLKLLEKLRTRVLIVDELAYMLSGTTPQRNIYSNVIRHLSNELEISIVGVGTKKLLRTFQTDQQSGSRFEPLFLPRWKMGQDYFAFIVQICLRAGLKPDGEFTDKAFIERIFRMSEGLTGETWKLMCLVIEHAVRSGKETVSPDMLKKVDWVAPSERRKMQGE